jgi:hypothetical protein
VGEGFSVALVRVRRGSLLNHSDPERLAELTSLGADAVVSLGGEPDEISAALGAAAADVDAVVDYLRGSVTDRAIPAVVSSRTERSQQLAWIQAGSMAGMTITLPSAALRAANLQLLVSGQGSLNAEAIIAELPELAHQISSGAFKVDPVSLPLSNVESAWDSPTSPGQRVVFEPNGA